MTTNKRVSYIITDSNIACNYDGQTHIVKRSDALAEKLIKAIKENKLHLIPELVSVAKRIEKLSNGAFYVKNGRVQVNGVDAPQVLSDKIVRFSNEDLPFQPLLKFAENLQANPSYRAVQELYGFLEKNNHPITENGAFLAFKRVRHDFKDIYTGTFDNSPGNTVEVPRNMVDEDSSHECSNGLHCANFHYAHLQYGSDNRNTDVMLEVEVNPADVVAIPADYLGAKMRVSKYKVLGVVDQPFDENKSLRRNDDYDSKKTDSDCECCCKVCGGDVDGGCGCDEQIVCLSCDYEYDAGEECCPECGVYQGEEDEQCDSCGEFVDDCICGCEVCGELIDNYGVCECNQGCGVCSFPLPDTDVKHGYETCWSCRLNQSAKRPGHDDYPYDGEVEG